MLLKKVIIILEVLLLYFYWYLNLNETMLWLNKAGFFMFGVVLLKINHTNGYGTKRTNEPWGLIGTKGYKRNTGV